MIPKACKRLAEVDFPIAVVSKHAAREKSIRHGHPSTLHLWWARRPLAACRAMLLALLLPDPCDPQCPKEFKKRARAALAPLPQAAEPDDDGLRRSLLRFIGDFANWDLAAHPMYLKAGRELVKAAHPEETPLVVDPFAGGGSIPLEALRLGCDAFASDLNPVACLILKVMLEDIPRHGPELADELRRVGKEIKEAAERELTEFYPPDPDGAKPIAYLWARTVRCESPNCGAEIPLMRSFWLCKKANRKRALRCSVERPNGQPPRAVFEIFQPKNDREVPGGTVSRAKATCLCCGNVLPPDRVRAQLAAQRGGADTVFDKHGHRIGGARLLAVVTLRDDALGRSYRLPTDADYAAVWKAQKRIKKILADWEELPPDKRGLCPVPDEPLPPIGTLGFRVQRYGMLQWGDLFSARQKVALLAFSQAASSAKRCLKECKNLLAIAVGRAADATASLTRWLASGEEVKNVFSRQALPIVWDFGETNPTSEVSRSWRSALDAVLNVMAALTSAPMPPGQVEQADACQSRLPDSVACALFTDPPYYDAIPYSDLSDFFLVWLKRTLPGYSLLKDPFDPLNDLSPKAREAVQDETKISDGCPKDRKFFEKAMSKAFGEGRRILKDDGVACVVFAHKTTEGWEALLSGMIKAGWTITGSWPIATEAGNRPRARESAALATSVHLVCRPRISEPHVSDARPLGSAGGNALADARGSDRLVGDWGEVLRELPGRVMDWIERLQSEGVRGADLVFACIGPALEIFSRYSRVETAEGREVMLAEYLEKVWETVGRAALGQVLGTAEAKARNGAAGAVEEDARLTALFLWTLQSTDVGVAADNDEEEETEQADDDEDAPRGKAKGGFSLIFDVARRFAQPLGIHLDTWEGRIIETEKGVVRLLSVSERAQQLFGEDGAQAVAAELEKDPLKAAQMTLFPELEEDQTPRIRGRKAKATRAAAPGSIVSDDALRAHREATTLDRVHAAMLLQKSGRTNALRALLKAEQDRSPDFLRLANALSALYPRDSEEKRLVDAMLLAVPR